MTRDRRPDYAVHTADRADDVVLDGLLAECTALRQLDADLAGHYGAPGLVGDLWRAAYCRQPELLRADEIQPRAQINHALVAAQLGSPEHCELRRTTAGDAFASALAVVCQGPALRRLLRQLDDERDQAEQAQQQADQAAAASAAAGPADPGAGDDEQGHGGEGQHDGAEDGQGEEQGEDGVADSGDAAENDAQPDRGETDAAAAHRAEKELQRALAAAPIRAAARQAAQDAGEQLDDVCGRAAAWGLDAELQRLSADERMRLADRLTSGKLREFADLIGRFRQLARAQRSRRVEHVRGEYVGVTLGDDLGSLIPAELANLAVPALRADFAARYAEQRLMVYDQRGDDHEAQGAIIALIDCSWSMQDPFTMTFAAGATPPGDQAVTAEAYAKALALALLDQARAARPVREFAAILFDERVDKVFRYPAHQPLDHAHRIELAERFSGGGTDFMAPLEEAVKLLAAEHNATGRQKADLVLITDGDAWVSGQWVEQWWTHKRQLGFRAFGIEIGRGGSPAVAAICDDTRTIADLTDTHATAELFRSI